MRDYIEREAAMAAACKALCHPGVLCPDFKCAEVRDAFNAIPAADVRPVVHGEWIKGVGENGVTTSLFCSECGYENKHWYEWKFCPNCSAQMDKDGEV